MKLDLALCCILLGSLVSLILSKQNPSSSHSQQELNNNKDKYPNADEVIYVHLIPHSHDDLGWLKTVDMYFSGNNET